MFGNWFKKEAPFQGFMGFGGGATNLFYGAGVTGPGVNYFGDENDGAFNSTGSTTLTVTNKNGSFDGDIMIKRYSSFTLNSGHALTVDQPCRGLIIFCTGNVEISGPITMATRGAYADTIDNSTNPNSNVKNGPSGLPSDGMIWRWLAPPTADQRTLPAASSGDFNTAGPPTSFLYTYQTNQANNIGAANGLNKGAELRLSRQGAGGGAGVDSPPGGTPGTAGTAGTNTASSGLYTMSCGGGGAGSNGNYGGGEPSGAGSYGSCFGGGAGGGGNRASNPHDPGQDATIWGGAGGFGDNGGNYNHCGGGGAGNPGGAGNKNDPTATAANGQAGTGGLIMIIASGNVTLNPTGVLDVRGANGGPASNYPDCNSVESAGGGSGGGIIAVAHGGTFTNNGSVYESGGEGGVAASCWTGGGSNPSTGGDGGTGVFRSIHITDKDGN